MNSLIVIRTQLGIANRIYRGVIPGQLTWITAATMTHDTAWSLRPERRLNPRNPPADWQQSFREHGGYWTSAFNTRWRGA